MVSNGKYMGKEFKTLFNSCVFSIFSTSGAFLWQKKENANTDMMKNTMTVVIYTWLAYVQSITFGHRVMELSLHHHKELDVQFFLSSYNHIKTNS
jgi:hypothetical protein